MNNKWSQSSHFLVRKETDSQSVMAMHMVCISRYVDALPSPANIIFFPGFLILSTSTPSPLTKRYIHQFRMAMIASYFTLIDELMSPF